MRILLAPDKFRGTFSAGQVCDHLARGIRAVDPDVDCASLPLADGGEGTLDVVLAALGGTRVPIAGFGPLGDSLDGAYGVTQGGTTVIESSMFCGLALLPVSRRDPLRASTEGLGRAIAAALDAGSRRFLLGIGGTATVDGGIGMARALGFRFEEPGEGSLVSTILADDAHPGLKGAAFTCLCDVASPLLGPRGAAAVFGPQKGATPMDVTVLELRLSALAAALRRWRDRDISLLPGAGAGGGLGAGAAGFLDAALEPGGRAILRLVGFEKRLAGCDLVVTGEGAFDPQSLSGKVVGEVLAAASAAGKPAVVVAGRRSEAVVPAHLAPAAFLDASVLRGDGENLSAGDLEEAGRRIARMARNPGAGQPPPG